MIDVRELSLSFKKNQILKNVNFSVKPGEFVSLVGPSGSGKSSILNVISGLSTGSVEGQVEVGIPKGKIGYLFQDDSLLPWKNVKKNIGLGLKYSGFSTSETKRKAESWISKMKISGQENKFPAQVSGGQRKRAAIAQVMILRPDLILMDEPFSSLDAIVRAKIVDELMLFYRKYKITVVLVTHDLEEAISLSDRVYLLSNGPAATIHSQYEIDIPVTEQLIERKTHPNFNLLYAKIWEDLSKIVNTTQKAS